MTAEELAVPRQLLEDIVVFLEEERQRLEREARRGYEEARVLLKKLRRKYDC